MDILAERLREKSIKNSQLRSPTRFHFWTHFWIDFGPILETYLSDFGTIFGPKQVENGPY